MNTRKVQPYHLILLALAIALVIFWIGLATGGEIGGLLQGIGGTVIIGLAVYSVARRNT